MSIFQEERNKRENLDIKNYVECEECKKLINRAVAQRTSIGDFHPDWMEFYSAYYCQTHKKSYDRAAMGTEGPVFFYKMFETDENGIPEGFQRIQLRKSAKK